ncbi:chromosome segregation SMC family protein [Vallitalea sediminicola]
MIINKVYIKNFKGIKDKKIIDFSNYTSLIIGPNGFGKTTIFDIIELCLTGIINRTYDKANVTKDISDYKKPFYQNTVGKDVIVKLWLINEQKNKKENLIIVKYLSRNNDGKCEGKGRRNKPCDFNLLSTYKELPEDFENDEFTPIEENKIDNDYIDKFFDFSINFKIENIYKLFNYLQQEDTTYFLKKSEKDRKNSLGFLFQTDQQEVELEIINKAYNNLNIIKDSLKKKLDVVKKNEQKSEVKYKKIFTYKNFEFDKINIFDKTDLDLCIEGKRQYVKELNEISEFINRFSPDEYMKKIKIEQIDNMINNNNFIYAYILKKFIDKRNYELLEKERKILNNKSLLEAYILQKCISKYEDYELINRNHKKYNEFLNIKEYSYQLEEMVKHVEQIIPHRIEEFLDLLETRNNIIVTANEIEITISEIIRLRNSLKTEFEKNQHNIINDTICPYCGKHWETYDALLLAFSKREEVFKKLETNQVTRLEQCNKIIKVNFIEPIINYMNNYIKNNNKLDSKILELLKLYKDNEYNFDDIKKINMKEEFTWSKPYTYEELVKRVKLLEKNIESNLYVSKEVFDKIKMLYNISFENEIGILEKICSQNELNNFLIPNNKEKIITINDVERKSKLLKDFLDENKKKYQYDYNRTYDNENMYERYFDSQKEKFLLLNETCVKLKKDYIEFKFTQKQNLLAATYEKRYDKIDNIVNRIGKLKTFYNRTIIDYKKDMVNKIKIPFYIYTAKILQNYQQGMGVFLSTKENSDSIRFLTDSSSDHDAMHHLSSGQLSVVSLAFCLAINKTYNISKNLKFLIIDDPIQEMDALNIHSFIELMRHEFLKDYQLIFSTHNDSNALYIKYKFEKIEENSVKMINVQDEFFNLN